MSRIPQDIALEITSWTIHNHERLYRQYPKQYVACGLSGVIAHGQNLDEVLELANRSGEYFLINWIPKRTSSVQFLAIRFNILSRDRWEPLYPVTLNHKHHQIDTEMVVDSGADVSLISWQLGKDLGFGLADAEANLAADGVGGKVEYVLRNIELVVDGRAFPAPVAWLQTELNNAPLLLGREVVFELFNIEFRQADEQIIFTWRG
jgi:Family of unknown function (DUF5678)